MYFDASGFKEALRGTSDCKGNAYGELECMLLEHPEEERKALRQQFFLDLRVMKARTYEEIRDIPLKKIIDCIGTHGVFSDMFERLKAGNYFSRFRRIATVRTCRKRRIL